MDKTGDRDLARDLVQESFINLYQHKDQIEESTSIKAYLYVILKNRVINSYQKSVTYRKYDHYLHSLPVTPPLSPLAYVESRELEQQIANEIENLPPQCQLVFKLSRGKYLSDKEIATELNISVNTVEQHKRKALQKLRVSLGEYLGLTVFIYLIGR